MQVFLYIILPFTEKYYLVDSGYTNMPGFLSPYRGERYHLRDFRGNGRQPSAREELFNYRHSSLRNVIERCFGVLKARFPILKQMPPYPLRTQKYIPNACCTIHNFIRMHASVDPLFEEFANDQVIDNGNDGDGARSSANVTVEIDVSQHQLRQMARLRDQIANQLWVSVQRD